MELLQLKYFSRTAKNGSIAATAKEFSVPPSSVSQSIKRLENELETKLFLRNANKISLSEKGALFAKFAENALETLKKGVEEIGNGSESKEINICINTNRRIVMETVEKFKKLFPDVTVKISHSSDNFDEDFDVIIDKERSDIKNYKMEKLIEENLAVAFSKESVFSQSKNLSGLKDAPFITMNKHTSLYEMTLCVCKKLGFTPKIAIQSDDPFYIRKCVELDLGVAVVPLFSWQGQFSDKIVLKKLKDCTRTTFLYVNNKKHLPFCVSEFAKMLAKSCGK